MTFTVLTGGAVLGDTTGTNMDGQARPQ